MFAGEHQVAHLDTPLLPGVAGFHVEEVAEGAELARLEIGIGTLRKAVSAPVGAQIASGGGFPGAGDKGFETLHHGFALGGRSACLQTRDLVTAKKEGECSVLSVGLALGGVPNEGGRPQVGPSLYAEPARLPPDSVPGRRPG